MTKFTNIILGSTLQSVFPNREDAYKQVHALLISWGPNDALGTAEEIESLIFCSECHYSFSTEHYVIPTERSQTELAKKLSDVNLERAAAGNLLIVHYGGDGIRVRQAVQMASVETEASIS